MCEETFLEINGESYINRIASSPKFNLAKIKSLEELIAFTLMILKSGITPLDILKKKRKVTIFKVDQNTSRHVDLYASGARYRKAN